MKAPPHRRLQMRARQEQGKARATRARAFNDKDNPSILINYLDLLGQVVQRQRTITMKRPPRFLLMQSSFVVPSLICPETREKRMRFLKCARRDVGHANPLEYAEKDE